MLRIAATTLLLLFSAIAHGSDSGLVSKRSGYSVAETLDRMEAVLESKGIMVFSRIDHAAGAASVGSDLPPTQLLLFGNPKLGTPLMQSNRHIAIDLPLKVIAWQDSHGTVWLSYNDPAWLKQRHAIADRDPVFAKISVALNQLTDRALSPELKLPSSHE